MARNTRSQNNAEYTWIYRGEHKDYGVLQHATMGSIVIDDMQILQPDGKIKPDNKFVFKSLSKGYIMGYYVCGGIRVPHNRTRGHIRAPEASQQSKQKRTEKGSYSLIVL